MKIYVSGKITGLSDGETERKFFAAKVNLIKQGHSVMNPAVLGQNGGFEHSDYMHICFSMIDVCDAVWMMKDWQTSRGARMELQYAADWRKEILYEDESTREENFPIMYAHPKNRIDWKEEDVWEYIRTNNLPYCKLYDEGWRRIGCLFCPMSTKKEKQRQCREYPKYKDAFVRAFDRMIASRRADGKHTTWNNGAECFDWWIHELRPADKNDGFTQIDFL